MRAPQKIFTIILMTGFAILSADQTNTNSENSTKAEHLNELPKHEQLAHNSLMKKLELLHIHTEHLLALEKSIVELMKLLEKEKDVNGDIDQDKYMKLLDKLIIPKIQSMKTPLEKLKNDGYVGYKVQYCLEFIEKNDQEALIRYFEFLEKEILTDICHYEKSTDLQLPQYRYGLEIYGTMKRSHLYTAQLLIMMNKKIFYNE